MLCIRPFPDASWCNCSTHNCLYPSCRPYLQKRYVQLKAPVIIETVRLDGYLVENMDADTNAHSEKRHQYNGSLDSLLNSKVVDEEIIFPSSELIAVVTQGPLKMRNRNFSTVEVTF